MLPLHQREIMAGVLGVEPRLTDSNSVVLPLHYTPIVHLWFRVVAPDRFDFFTEFETMNYLTSRITDEYPSACLTP